jgi:hypothetical protein
MSQAIRPVPANGLKAAHGVRHMKGAGNENPNRIRRRVGKYQAETDIFSWVARLPLKKQAFRRQPLCGEKTSGDGSLRSCGISHVPTRTTATRKKDLRIGKAPDERGRIAICTFIKLHLVLKGTGMGVFATTEHDDAIDSVKDRIGRIVPLDQLQEEIANRQGAQRDQQHQ